jgi:transcriptional regulator with XRE-family HTH domain
VVETLDKVAIGQRIKHLRKSRSLRQWQMAQLLGATQPAVHKYENGILPEVRRLLELARIGNTSVEWILTGRHWENGSTEMDRMRAEVFDLARQIHAFSPEERRAVGAALEVLHAASRHLREGAVDEVSELTDNELGRRIRAFEGHVLEPLMAALAVYDAVVTTLAQSRVQELHGFTHSGTETIEKTPDRAVSVPALQKNAG